MISCLLVIAAALQAASPPTDAGARAARYEQLHEQTQNATLLWLAAEAHAEAGNASGAVGMLKRIIGRGLGFTVTPESSLARLAGDAEFDALAVQLAAEFPKVRRAREAASIRLPGLVPEGIAADPGFQRTFVGDMANKKIWVLAKSGPPRSFAGTGNLRPLGMKVDRASGLLWVAASTSFWKDAAPESALLAFDLQSGKSRGSFRSADLKSINDVAIAPNGDVYATDSLGGAVFRLRSGGDRLERVTEAGKMGYPNGLAVSGDGRSVYIAQGIALRRLDVATGELKPVPTPPSLALLSIDGLYWRDGSLIAIQNAGNSGRVLRLLLSANGTAVTSFDTLEAGNPHFDLPTTGTLDGAKLYVIANSQLRRLGDNGRITGGPPLKPIVLLEIAIPGRSDDSQD
jgi:hypothetical protein